MTHTYKITGMTCAGCQAKVQQLLSQVPGVNSVSVDLARSEASIGMERHIATADLQAALQEYPKYQLTELEMSHADPAEAQASWIATYKPVLLIGTYIAGISTIVEIAGGQADWKAWMEHFMGGFFISFSFFKLLDLNGFADSYAMYDVVAKRIRTWGYAYPFVELLLGLAYLVGFNPLLTNLVTLLIMGISIVGVLQSVLNKRRIRCACLGAVFNLPMSTVTIIEDLLMIVMSAVMLATLL